MTPIHVVGIGLDGAAGLGEAVERIVAQATLLVGSTRHLSYFPNHPADRLVLGNLHEAIQTIRSMLGVSESTSTLLTSPGLIVILTSGDPLFFGLGRLLLTEFAPEQLTFHPHLSSVQLAFSRVKVPWQDARLISAHGRSLDELTQALQRGTPKIAVLTDGVNTPEAIARLLLSLDLPHTYQVWVCEDLDDATEQVQCFTPEALIQQVFAPLNVVILLQTAVKDGDSLQLEALPIVGLPDNSFLSFSDRPGLMTKREVRLLAIGELALQPGQVVWDIGAGTGSVSVEIARLLPASQVYAIEQSAAGIALVQQNSRRFQVKNIIPVHGSAPGALEALPPPDRIFIGGSGGNLATILDLCAQRLHREGVIVLALATLEHLTLAMTWLQQQPLEWKHRLLQAQLARSVPVGALTRLNPLNPVMLLTLNPPHSPKHSPRP